MGLIKFGYQDEAQTLICFYSIFFTFIVLSYATKRSFYSFICTIEKIL